MYNTVGEPQQATHSSIVSLFKTSPV